MAEGKMTAVSPLPSAVTLELSEASISDSSEEDEDITWMTSLPPKQDIPPEYWHMQKLVKYIKGSTPSTTALVLACLNDYDLDTEFMQLAVREMNTLEVLVNLLETSHRDFRCKKLSLMVLARVTVNVVVQHEVTNLGIIPLLVELLMDPARDLQRLAAAVIANVAKLKKSSKLVRICGGIPVLVNLLDTSENSLQQKNEELSVDAKEQIEVAMNAASALWSLSHSNRNKEDMQKAGIIGLLPKLLKSRHENIVTQTMGMLQNCGNLPKFQMAIQTMDLVEDIVRLLITCDNIELKRLCSLAIFRHSEDEKIRNLVHKHQGLTPLVRLLQQESTTKNKQLLSAATGAIWKLAFSVDNVRQFDTLNTIPVLVQLLSDDDETVLVHVVGALAECAKLSHNAAMIQRAGGIQPLVLLLNLTNQALLANTAHVLGECAWDLQCMEEMEEHDAVRLIWSLLKNSCTKVQANAAWALVPCIKNATESGEMVRSFVGGIELIVKLLHSPDSRVVACVCAALAAVAEDKENLAVVTDLGVVPILANLAISATENEFLQEHLASAIANCCDWGKNCFEFGRLGTVTPLVNFLYHGTDSVKASTIHALSQLSADPFNCITLHQSGVVPEGTGDTVQQTPRNEESFEPTSMPPNHGTRPQKEKHRSSRLRPNVTKKRKSAELTTDVLVAVRDHFKKPPTPEDRYDLMGKSFAMRIRSLEHRQRLIVEKRINDILFEAEMGMLNTQTNLYNMDYTSSNSSETSGHSPHPTLYDSHPHQEESSQSFVRYLSEFNGN